MKKTQACPAPQMSRVEDPDWENQGPDRPSDRPDAAGGDAGPGAGKNRGIIRDPDFHAYIAIAIAVLALILVFILAPTSFFRAEVAAGRCHPLLLLITTAASLGIIALAAYLAAAASPRGDRTVFAAAMATFILFALWVITFFNTRRDRSLVAFVSFFYILSLFAFGYVVLRYAPAAALLLIYPMIFSGYLLWWSWKSGPPPPEVPI